MTSQKDQIQALIAEIDSVLKKANSRLPWVVSGEIAQQRQVLERVRNYLVGLQQQLPIEGLRQEEAASPVGYPPEFYPSGAFGSLPAVDAQQMMQTILQEMSYLRASIMQPMQADLENLRQRRELLTQELSHLEAERQNQPLAQRLNQPPNPQQFSDELVQVLMSRLQESLSQQIGQALGIQAQALSSRANSSSSGEPLPGVLANPQYEQLQALRSRSDQMLVNLDSTLSIVFESLQRNVQAYQVSLTQGLERMHSLGQQSEVAFKSLISELAQQLNQEASSYLFSLAQGQAAANPEAANPAHGESFNHPPESLSESTIEPAIAPSPSPNSPYPGRSVSATDLSAADLIGSVAAEGATEEQSLPPMPELDAALESWLRSADSSNFDVTELISSASSTVDLGTPLSDSALAQPEVFPYLSDAGSPVESFATVSQIAISEGLTSDLAITAKDSAELDEALKLLEELSSELNDPLAATVPIPDSSVEQDEFYQSLFGDSATAEAGQSEADPAESEANDFVEQSAIAPLNDRSTDFSPEATNFEAGELQAGELQAGELDNIDHSAVLADFTFESSGSDLELPELFFEAARETETTSITELPASLFTELPASLFDDDPIPAPSLEPFPLTAETESLLADLKPFSLEPDPLEPDSLGSLSDLFQDLAPSAQSTPIDPPAIAIDWASLQNAAPSVDTPQSVQTDPLTIGLPDSEFALEGREDQFTRAALDENLLPDAFHEVANLNLDLDDFTLSGLSEDLSNVETSTIWQPDRVTDDLPSDDLPSLDEFALFLEDNSQETVQPLDQTLSDRADLTIEEFGTFFDDIPNISPQIPSPQTPPPAVSSSLPTFSLQQTQSPAERLSTSAPQLPPPPQIADDGSLPFTLEGMDDLFAAPDIVALSSPPPPRPTVKEISPFKPDYGRPDYGRPDYGQPAEAATPFKLEQLDNIDQLDNLLIETPPLPPASPDVGSQEGTSNTLATDSLPSLPENPSDPPVSLGLDEAFESLLGKPTPLQPSTLNEQAKEEKQAKEKKKTL